MQKKHGIKITKIIFNLAILGTVIASLTSAIKVV